MLHIKWYQHYIFFQSRLQSEWFCKCHKQQRGRFAWWGGAVGSSDASEDRLPGRRHLLPVWQANMSDSVWIMDSRQFSASDWTQSLSSGSVSLYFEFRIRSSEFKSGENNNEWVMLPRLRRPSHGQSVAKDSTEDTLLWLHRDCSNYWFVCFDSSNVLASMWMWLEDRYRSNSVFNAICTTVVDCWKCSWH